MCVFLTLNPAVERKTKKKTLPVAPRRRARVSATTHVGPVWPRPSQPVANLREKRDKREIRTMRRREEETNRHQSAREETRENKKSLKIVMFDSQASRQHRPQGLKKEKEGTFKNLGLVAAQCNGIAACAYSLKLFTVYTLLYLTI